MTWESAIGIGTIVIAVGTLIIVVYTPFGHDMYGSVRRMIGRQGSAEEAPDGQARAETTAPPAELPVAIGEFAGREDELAELHARSAAIDDPRRLGPVLITISGKPGVGKSVLAIRFAHEVRKRYPGGQLYVDLEGASSDPLPPAEALIRLVRALGISGPSPAADIHSLASLFRTRMDGRRAILVLDNAASEAQVRMLLPAATTCLVLITSRDPMDGLTSSLPLHLDVMSRPEAMQLLAKIAGDEVTSLPNHDAAAQVAQQCGYLPLALAIAAVRMRKRPGQPVRDMARRLANERSRLEVLKVGDRDVRASFDISYGQLSGLERTLWCRLRIFPEARVTPQLAAALLDCPVDTAEHLLDRLVDTQVLELLVNHQYGFHDLIGLYADEKLEEEPSAERRGALGRALRVYVDDSLRNASLVRGAIVEIGAQSSLAPPTTIDQQLAALDWFERERITLVAAVRRAEKLQLNDLTWMIAASLAPFFELRGYPEDWRTASEAAARAADALDHPFAQAWTRLDAGHCHWIEGQLDKALGRLEEALQIAQEGRWPRLEARTLYLMGRIGQGTMARDRQPEYRLRQALSRYQLAFDIFHREGLVHEQADVLLRAASTYQRLGELDPGYASQLAESLLRTFEGEEEEIWVLRTLGQLKGFLGEVQERLSNPEQAGMHYFGSVRLYRRIGFQFGHACALRNLGRVREQQRSWSLAEEALTESAARFRTIGNQHEEGLTLLLLGDLKVHTAGRAKAVEQWDEAFRLLTEAGSPDVEEARRRLTSARSAEPST
jgi:tetratricopeptide (TPR) repeat protein